MIRKEIRAIYGETVKVTNDWTAECEKRNTTVTSSSWIGIPVTNEVLASNVATASMSTYYSGLVRNTVSLANGDTLIADRLVWVK